MLGTDSSSMRPNTTSILKKIWTNPRTLSDSIYFYYSSLDFDTEAGRKVFEAETERFIRLYPGAICKEGEKFDFQTFYARKAIHAGKDLTKFGNLLFILDPALVENARKQI